MGCRNPFRISIDPKTGQRRLIMFSGLHPVRMAVSEDDGATWTPLAPIGDFGGIVTMSSVERLANGDYIALFHDDGRFLRKDGARTGGMWVYKTLSTDGGLTFNNISIADNSWPTRLGRWARPP